MPDRKESIVRAFAAADVYDDYAVLQHRVAERFAAGLAELPLPPRPRICEIGCGTGFLSAALAERLTDADWLITDLCPTMVARAQARLAGPRFRFAVLDGERPDALSAEPPFDLICSSLAAQWFSDLEGALQQLFRHIRPGGHLAMTTLAAGTFAEWRKAHEAIGLKAGTPDFPTLTVLRSLRLGDVAARVDCGTVLEQHQDGRTFLSALKAIGAQTPSASHTPLTTLQLRAVLRQFEQQGARARYRVATLTFTKPR